jgi:quercetin dioxygenase-like cupin family protein
MSDQNLAHQMTDFAAAYALGALTQHETRAFEEHLAEGCETCNAEVESFEQTANALGFAASGAEPPQNLRGELLMRLNGLGGSAAAKRSEDFISIRASEGEWREVQAGVMLKQLHVDHASGIATSLVRMLPGTSLPPHEHSRPEQFYVIEGDCNVRGQRLGPGDYHRAAAGSIHDSTYTVDGTLFLLVAPERYEALHSRSGMSLAGNTL